MQKAYFSVEFGKLSRFLFKFTGRTVQNAMFK